MKKFLIIIFFMMSACLIFVPATMALTISDGDLVQVQSYNPNDMAGIFIFNVKNNGGSPLGTYDTFCIQETVYIYPGTWYQVELSDYVGKNPNNSGDKLNGAVDYLFYRYKSGAYDTPFAGSYSNQADFQKLLWSLQGTGDPFSSTGTLWASDLGIYTSDSSLHHPWGTEVINLYTENTNGGYTEIQNQLYNQVPEPMTLLLLGFGLIGVAGLRRRLKA